MPLGVSQGGEGGVGGGVYASQLLQGLAVLLQPLSGSLEAVREGQRGEGGGCREFGLWRKGGEVGGYVSPGHAFLASPRCSKPAQKFRFIVKSSRSVQK